MAAHPSDNIRAFIGLSLNAGIIRHINGLIRQMQASAQNVKWIDPRTAHITLKFLGETSPEQADAIKPMLADIVAATQPFTLQLTSCGAFPSADNPNILWVGFNDLEGHCRRLAATLNDACAPMGFTREHRPFQGHITIGRTKGRHKEPHLAAALACLSVEPLQETVTAISLYKSVLTPSGPVYDVMEKFEIKS